MKRILENLWFGALSCLVVAGVLWIVLGWYFLDNTWGFWFVAAACGALILWGLRAWLRRPESRYDSATMFLVAIIALIVLVMLSTYSYFRDIGAAALLLPIVFVGIPFGIGIMRHLRSEFRPLVRRDILAGAVGGMAGVALGVVPLATMLQWSFLAPQVIAVDIVLLAVIVPSTTILVRLVLLKLGFMQP